MGSWSGGPHMYGNMRPNYGAYNMEPPQRYPDLGQQGTAYQVPAPPGGNVVNVETQVDRIPKARTSYQTPAAGRPLPALRTSSAKQAGEPLYDRPVVHGAVVTQTKAIGLGKLLGVPIASRKASQARWKSPFGSLW